jgi:hypothetical protein
MAMRFKRLSLAFVALVAFLAGCPGATAPGACPGWIQRAIEVDVTDSRTGLPVAAGTTGTLRDGAYVEALRVVGWRGLSPNDTATTLGGAEGRRGTYAVRVERPGYVAWERSSIVARVGACGVETVRLGAALTPQS